MKPCLVPISVFWILAALFYSTPALAVDRYVRLNGFDTGDCTSFLQACRTPGYALDVALPGDEIVIGEGEYSQHLVIDKNISIRGAGRGETVLLPFLVHGLSPNSRVITISGAYHVSIASLTIERGDAGAGQDGGGIYSQAAKLTLHDVLFNDNLSRRNGGGVYHGGGQLSLSNVVMLGNRATNYGGAIHHAGADLSVKNSLIEGSEAGEYGNGIYHNGDQLTVLNTVLVGNFGSERGGGLYLNAGQASIVNTTVARNIANSGGGLYVTGSTVSLSNTIVWDNIASQGQGNEIFNSHLHVFNVRNSIYRNRSGQSDIVEGAGFSVNAGSMSDDPLWVSTSWQDRDFRLRPMSPAVNAGSNAYYADAGGALADDLDLSGLDRVWNYAGGGIIDIGAFEFQGEPADLAPPELELPAHGVVDLPRLVHFSWSKVEDADSYQLQIADSDDRPSQAFVNPVFDDVTATLGIEVKDLNPLHDYDWRVRAIKDGFVGDWSEVRRLTTEGHLQAGPGNIIHVRPFELGDGTGRDWNNAYGSLAGALKWAAHKEGKGLWDTKNPLQIWVSQGTYRPEYPGTDLVRLPGVMLQNTLVLVPDVKIFGGFPSTGAPDMAARDPVTYPSTIGVPGVAYYNLVVAAGPVGVAQLDGFTLQGANARGQSSALVRGETVGHKAGGAIHIVNSAPALSQLHIINNRALELGAGIYASNSQARLDRVRIESNQVAEYWGGGLYSHNGNLLISNSLFVGNEAPFGGAIHQVFGQLHVINSTIFDNFAIGAGGGIYNASGALTVDNAIVWGNQAGGSGHQHFNEGGTGLWRYTLFANGSGDIVGPDGLSFEHALHQDPQFADPAGGNYLPGPGSPAVDSGSNALYETAVDLPWDLGGNARIAAGTIDRGALETPALPGDLIFRDRFE